MIFPDEFFFFSLKKVLVGGLGGRLNSGIGISQLKGSSPVAELLLEMLKVIAVQQ